MPVDLIVRCVHGIEWICAHEIEERLPEATQLGLSRREVAVRVPMLDRTPLGLRTADDVFLAVGGAMGATPDEVAAALLGLHWQDCVADVGRLRAVPPAPVLDVVAAVEGHRFSRFAVEHAVGPRLAALLDGSYLRRTAEGREPGEPDLTVRVSVRDGAATAAIRLAAQPLHRRGWKQHTGPGTLHPPMAAALARLAGVEPGQSVLDPFCGDGTIAIETALAYPDALVTGTDINPFRLDNAARNAARAGARVALKRLDAAESNTHVDAVITNPPWNLTVDALGQLSEGLEPWGRRLYYTVPRSGRVVVLADDEEAFDVLQPLRRGGKLHYRLLTQVRLAGRMARIVLAGQETPELPPGLRERWHFGLDWLR